MLAIPFKKYSAFLKTCSSNFLWYLPGRGTFLILPRAASRLDLVFFGDRKYRLSSLKRYALSGRESFLIALNCSNCSTDGSKSTAITSRMLP
jgi:hypothetical protein